MNPNYEKIQNKNQSKLSKSLNIRLNNYPECFFLNKKKEVKARKQNMKVAFIINKIKNSYSKMLKTTKAYFYKCWVVRKVYRVFLGKI